MIRYFIRAYILLIILSVMLACEDNNNAVTESDPVIIKIKTSSYWNIKNNQNYTVEVVVEDPQGYDNIASATLKIKNSEGGLLYESALYDDGAYLHPDDGDKIANDGIYTNVLNAADVTNTPGSYTFTATAEDADGNTAQPVEIPVVFDYSVKPIITNLSAPDTIGNIQGNQYFFATVYDSGGMGNIENVCFQLEEAQNEGVLKTYYMYNDGTNGDVTADDSVYTYLADSSFAVNRSGDYKLTFIAKNLFDQTSAPIIHHIYYLPQRPIITKVSMPDSLKRPEGVETVARLIEVWVTDAQGRADIDSVYFYSRKPDGELANNGNPIPLKDDGQNGDAVAGDGVYSFLMYMSSSAYIGTYKFYFYARDKGGNISDPVLKTLKVY